MSSFPNAQRTALHAQHSLKSDDLIYICHLANVEGIFESIESWRFEQFFGFTLHLFITTESPYTRQQVSQLLPKLGSGVVLPLIKISHYFPASSESTHDVRTLALQSLGNMEPHAFIIGLQAVLALECADELMPNVIEALVKLTRQYTHESISLLLSQLLPQASWKLVEEPFRQRLSQPNLNIGFEEEDSLLKIRVVTETRSGVDNDKPASKSIHRPGKTPLKVSMLSSYS